jgi:hypothetical protein
MSHPIVSHSYLPIFSCYSHTCCTAPTLHSMSTNSASNHPPTNSLIDDDAGSDSEAESTVITTSSSLTHDASLMANGEIPDLTDFFKGITISEEELQAYQSHGWLTGMCSHPFMRLMSQLLLARLYFALSCICLLGLGFPQ